MKTIMCCLALVAMGVFTSAAFAQEATLTSVEAKFDTTTDRKKQDSKLDVYVKNRDGWKAFQYSSSPAGITPPFGDPKSPLPRPSAPFPKNPLTMYA
jgi:hypothetical protein